MPAERISAFGNRFYVKNRHCKALGINPKDKKSDDVLAYIFGKCLLLVDKNASRKEVMRSLRLIKEDVALDSYLGLKLEKEKEDSLSQLKYSK